jgi:acyl-CoA thioesterase
MDEHTADAIRKEVAREPYARALGMELLDVKEGYARVRMRVDPGLCNIFGSCHGGAIFSLMDEAFQVACNSHGTLAVALHVGISYHCPPQIGSHLVAEATELYLGRRTANYLIQVRDEQGQLIASCQALAYRKGKPLPFLDEVR